VGNHRRCCCNEPCIGVEIEAFIKITPKMCTSEYLNYQGNYGSRDTPTFWVFVRGDCDEIFGIDGTPPTKPIIRDLFIPLDIPQPTDEDIEVREIFFGDTESVFMSDMAGTLSGFYDNEYIGMTRREDNETARIVYQDMQNELASFTRNAFNLTTELLLLEDWLNLDEDRIVFNTRSFFPAQTADHVRAKGSGAYIFTESEPFKEIDAFIDPDNGETLFSPLMQQLPFGDFGGIGFFFFDTPLVPGQVETRTIMAYDYKEIYPDGVQSTASSTYAGSTDTGEFLCFSAQCDPHQTGTMKFYAGAVDEPNPDKIDPSTGTIGDGKRSYPAFATFNEMSFGNCRRIYQAGGGECTEDEEPECDAEGLCHGSLDGGGEIKGGYGQNKLEVFGLFDKFFRTINGDQFGGSDTLKNRLLVFGYAREEPTLGPDGYTHTYHVMASPTGSCDVQSLEPMSVSITTPSQFPIGIPMLDYGSPLGSPANPYPNEREPDTAVQWHYVSDFCTNPSCFPPYDCRCISPDFTLLRMLYSYSSTGCNGVDGSWWEANVNVTNLPGDTASPTTCDIPDPPQVSFPN